MRGQPCQKRKEKDCFSLGNTAAFLVRSPWSCDVFLSLPLLLPHAVTTTPQFCSSLSLQSYTSLLPCVRSLPPLLLSACDSPHGLYLNPHLAAKSSGRWGKGRRAGEDYTQHFQDFILSNSCRRFRDAVKFAPNYTAHVDFFPDQTKPKMCWVSVQGSILFHQSLG